jgi:polysaccharide deacetylase 2 family uncharacterized protein YibQ
VAIAIALLAVAVAAVLLLARHRPRPPEAPPPAAPAPVDVVREVAGRLNCPPDRVGATSPVAPGTPITVTVNAPHGFPVSAFVQRLEAAAHNSGDRLEPRPMTEKGGYGLARLDGTLSGKKVRVVVLGEEPRPTPGEHPPTPRAGEVGKLAIVLDDAGYSLDLVRELERLPGAVAVAVLPNATQSREVVSELERQGREVLLHMPMEPLAGHGPGPGDGAVMVGESPAEVAARVESALAIVSAARGLNNHMGSRATADLPTMRSVMACLKGRGLFFLDSRTTPDSVAERAAREAGVPTMRREVFLDNVAEPDAVRRCLADAEALAVADGHAVAIGHVHAVTVSVLEKQLAALPGNVMLVRPSKLAR